MMKRMLLKLIGSFSHKIYHHVCKYCSNCQQEQVSTQHLGMMLKKIREKKKDNHKNTRCHLNQQETQMLGCSTNKHKTEEAGAHD